VVVVSEHTRSAPQGVRDSKLLTPAARELLAPRIRRWAVSHAVGSATPAEIDEFGMTSALRLAGHRALAGLEVPPDLILLDGNHDYLTAPQQPGLFGDAPPDGGSEEPLPVEVVTMVKGDMRCAAVAAASVLAKTTRDAHMVDLSTSFPEYDWAGNKGYSTAQHVSALKLHGATTHHRRSWSLPGVTAAPDRPDESGWVDSAGPGAPKGR
jgi:ribonuclease HII